MTSALVIANPVAGTSRVSMVRDSVDRRFTAAGWEYEWYETSADGRIAEVVQDALGRGLDLVVAAGGDGTVSATADALAGSEVPLGILPTGTGNGLARELGIPLSLAGALDLIAADHSLRQMDAIRLAEHYFLLNVTVGISAQMIGDTRRDAKRRFGQLAYIWTAIVKLAGLQPHRFWITVDGVEHTVRAAEIIVANSGAVGTPLARLGKHIRPDDGRIDIVVLRAGTVLRLLRVATSFVMGLQYRDPDVQYFVAERTVTIDSVRSLPAQADGETIGWTPVAMSVAPEAVRVIAPRHTRGQALGLSRPRRREP